MRRTRDVVSKGLTTFTFIELNLVEHIRTASGPEERDIANAVIPFQDSFSLICQSPHTRVRGPPRRQSELSVKSHGGVNTEGVPIPSEKSL